MEIQLIDPVTLRPIPIAGDIISALNNPKITKEMFRVLWKLYQVLLKMYEILLSIYPNHFPLLNRMQRNMIFFLPPQVLILLLIITTEF